MLNFTEIIFEESPWYIVLCIILAWIYSFILYQAKNGFSKSSNYGLASIRFLLVFLIALLLLVPLIKQIENLIEKPTIVFLIDNSESIILKDSLEVKKLISQISNSQSELKKSGYELDFITFDNKPNQLDKLKFDVKNTNLSQLLNKVKSNYEGRNLVASILISDGINNSGLSPEFTTYNFPINTIGIGDTSEVEDVFVKNILVNKIAYKGNVFPLKVEIGNIGFKNSSQKILLKNNNKIIDSKSIQFSTEKGIQEVLFLINTVQVGKTLFTIELPSKESEFNTFNNSKDVFIDIIDGQQKILLLANAPHPDIKALKEVVELQKNYELEIVLGSDLEKPIKGKYDLILFHQIPNKNGIGNALLTQFENNSKWFITGANSDYNKLNSIQKSIQFSGNINQTDNVFPSMKTDNDKFNFEPELITIIAQYPPITVPFADFTVSKSTYTIVNQRVGSIDSEKPLLSVQEENDKKTVFFIGEGLWRWKMMEYVKNENNIAFQKLISKTIQFAATKSDKRKLKVYPIKEEFLENESVAFDVEVYNDVFEKVYNKEISFQISNENKKLNYKFINSEKNTRFLLGNLEKGVYSYKATTQINDKIEQVNGQFAVSNMDFEAGSTTANFNLLKQIANNNEGNFYTSQSFENLKNELLKKEKSEKIISSYEELNELIQSKWIFFVLLFYYNPYVL